MDSLFGDAEEETETGEMSPKEAQKLLGGETASALVKELVARMEAFGFAASAGTGPDSGALLEVRGQFMNTDKKNKTVVGLETGDGDVQAEVQLYEATADGRAKLEEFKTATPRKAKPDLANDDWREEARADAARTAKDLAAELGRFFVAKGWITQQTYDEALR